MLIKYTFQPIQLCITDNVRFIFICLKTTTHLCPNKFSLKQYKI